MTSEIDGLALRRKLGRERFLAPMPWGNGWRIHSNDPRTTIIVTIDHWLDDPQWVHASISHPGFMPTYADLAMLHNAVFDNGWAYLPFTPIQEHVNDHQYCLHLWGRLDGTNALPDFTHGLGTI